jgi:hypothetical protein
VVVVYESNPFERNLSLTYCSKQKKQKNKNKSPNPKINSTKLFFFFKKKKLKKKKGLRTRILVTSDPKERRSGQSYK